MRWPSPVPIPPVLCFKVVRPKLIIVGPNPTSTRTVIGNRTNPRGMAVVDGLNLNQKNLVNLVIVMVKGITVGIKPITVAHPVTSLNKLNVDED